jgi:hypothetical protein
MKMNNVAYATIVTKVVAKSAIKYAAPRDILISDVSVVNQ